MMTAVSLREALMDSAREVFETMVFMAVEPADDDTSSLGETTLLGSITFKGHLEGCLGICCGEACARTIAANMLGLPNASECVGGSAGMLSTEELSENDISDAMGEIANMVMGAVKARIRNDVGNIEVSIPSVVQGRELKMGPQLRSVPVGNPNSLGEGAGRAKIRVNVEGQYYADFSLLYREGGKT